MFIRKTRKKPLANGSPLLHDDHGKPKTRREFIAQGLMAGSATVFGASVFSLFGNPRMAAAELSPQLQTLKEECGIAVKGAGKIPFICFDLAGGANIAGSNVLMGQDGGQMDFLSTAGYNKLGLPGDMLPSDPAFLNTDLGLAFHSDSGFLRGIVQSASAGTLAATNGAIIAARSENDTGNNPHNPMYGIHRAGADGLLLSLVGSQSSESGGNSLAPMNLIDPKARPTKIDRPSDVTGLVDVGDLIGILNQQDAVAVMESIQRISDAKMNQITTSDVVKDLIQCGYVKSADLADQFGNPASLDPMADPDIVGPAGIFSSSEFDGNREYQKTASVMKLVLEGYAGAGTITMGGYDYHTGERGTGERRDEQAGRCMGACLEYASRKQIPLMLYVFSDGSVSSNGRIDDSVDGRGKGEWTGDNQQTAASFFLVYNPAGRPSAIRNQIGHMRADASVETASSPAANNVNQLVQTVLLNYMALHGEQGDFSSRFMGHGLGNSASQDRLIAFENLVNGTIGS
jgi:hypothetical protein